MDAGTCRLVANERPPFCDNAKGTCPIFPCPVKRIHVGFHDPHGELLESFIAVRDDIRARLMSDVREALGLA